MLWPPVKIVGTAVVLVGVIIISRRHPCLAETLLNLACLFYTVVVAWNVVILAASPA